MTPNELAREDKRIKPLAWRRSGDCIICTSHRPNNDGYPFFNRNGQRWKIARAIMFRRHGEQPSSIVSRHTCDVRDCINPDHIIPGTVADNNHDRDERGHQKPSYVTGERHGHARLSNAQVVEIKELLKLGVFHRVIAAKFNVSAPHISDINRGRRRAIL